jgi:peptidyl-prolyl cis-trans isomerase C
MRAHRKSVRIRGPAIAATLVIAAGLWPVVATGADSAAPPANDRKLVEVSGRTILVADLEGYLRLRPPEWGAEPSEEALRKRLDEMVQAEALYAEALRRGIDREPEIRQTIRQVIVQRLFEREVDRPAFERKIADEELKKYYDAHLADFVRPEQARASDIFLAAPERGDPLVREAKRKQAEAVLAEALALQDSRFGFGELVLKRSDEPAGRPKGDTGFVDKEGKPAGIPKALAEALFAVERPGALVRSIVAAPEGFYVAMLTGRRASFSRPFEDEGVRREIDDRLRTDERRRLHDEFVKRVLGGAAVTIDDAALGELFDGMRAASEKSQAGGGILAPPAGSSSQAPPTVPGAGR